MRVELERGVTVEDEVAIRAHIFRTRNEEIAREIQVPSGRSWWASLTDGSRCDDSSSRIRSTNMA